MLLIYMRRESVGARFVFSRSCLIMPLALCSMTVGRQTAEMKKKKKRRKEIQKRMLNERRVNENFHQTHLLTVVRNRLMMSLDGDQGGYFDQSG